MLAKVTFYRVSRCGYYKWGSKVAEFGELPEALANLIQWTKDKDVWTTCPYGEPSDRRAFCLESAVSSNRKDAILATWNEVPMSKGGVAYLYPNSVVGSASVGVAELPEGAVPGYPTYFWFLPDAGFIATICFENRSSGIARLHSIFRGFLERFSKWVVQDDAEDSDLDGPEELVTPILGYADGAGDVTETLYPRFGAGMRRNPSKVEVIRNRREEIIRVVQHVTLKRAVTATPEHALLKSIAARIGLSSLDGEGDPVRLRYEMDIKPSPQQLQEILADYLGLGEAPEEEGDEDEANDAEAPKKNSWDDLGFKFRSDPEKTYWLSGTIARADIELGVAVDDAGIISARSLLEAIEGKRADLIKLITPEE